MTLDLILFRPEFFFLFSFFVLLWYGTGNLVTPVAEILTVTTGYSSGFAQSKNSQSLVNNKGYSRNITRGPNHAVSALT
jgi:hypothetical protein